MAIKVDLKGANRKLSKPNLERGLYAMSNQAMADMNHFVPFKEGELRQKVHASKGSVIYESKYAKRQFYLQGRKYTTPGTGPRWDLKAKSRFRGSLPKAFKKGAGF
ncbi:minor capsid protein [Lactococcus formosensis]|uniref:minor capsid protein n=1 Tax=Lactococcus formosensis TaxID=1281486 RepID=UPI002890595B|nr:minor capsid protein [Lactococcus formosensis]MDT2726501.1 minor capsid protein [Lactococcus formosensis]